MPASPAENAYDRVAYPSRPYADAHPQHLAMLATLFGLRPQRPDRARVLEIGCGAGGHLLPMALLMPETTFVGVDPAQTAIDAAQAQADRLGLRNVRFHAVSFTELARVEPSGVPFDYITAHGVYSWISSDLREAMLTTVRQWLAPDGVAYVSYNALPGWRSRGALREIMRYHTASMEDPAVRVSQARAVIAFLASAVPTGNEYSALLCSERDRMQKWDDAYLFHDHLSDENTPFWFHEFVADAERAGLGYVCEAHLSTMQAESLDPAIAEVIHGLREDVVGREQYLDFLRNRSFRQTLLCHRDRTVVRDLDGARLRTLSFVSRANPTSSDALPTQFRTGDGIELDTTDAVAQAMLVELAEQRPSPLAFDALLDAVHRRLGTSGDRETRASELGQHLLRCYALHGVVKPYAWAPTLCTRVSERPQIWSYAREQAAHGSRDITNLLHENMTIEDHDLRLLALCDGTRSRSALLDDAQRLFPTVRNLPEYLEDFLQRCAVQALLVEPESLVQSP
jgi:methyltransferase-like protein/2-polyprenyl-3-methyl-5-hydroxy-6-metoxy-1,4-benzoquinol methylase